MRDKPLVSLGHVPEGAHSGSAPGKTGPPGTPKRRRLSEMTRATLVWGWVTGPGVAVGPHMLWTPSPAVSGSCFWLPSQVPGPWGLGSPVEAQMSPSAGRRRAGKEARGRGKGWEMQGGQGEGGQKAGRGRGKTSIRMTVAMTMPL